MDLLSPVYLAFLVGAAFLFQVSPTRYRSECLVGISLAFYSLFSVISAGVMVCFAALVFLIAETIGRLGPSIRSRLLLWATIAGLVMYLVFLKAMPSSLGMQFSSPVTNFLAGLGASYYTFKLISYLLDVYWLRYRPLGNFSRFLACVSFFPQLPAGPIQRPSEFAFVGDATELPRLMVSGLRRILLGFLKKMAVADPLGAMVSMIASDQQAYQNQLWILYLIYPVQLYADFSALTDIAIGAASLFGVKSPENFRLPFFAPSISEYWRRWHMTLTRWVTDYVFMPLRMATRTLGTLGIIISLTVNMVLIGLWHGLTIGFLLFGLIHAAYLILDTLTATYRRHLYSIMPAAGTFMNVVGPVVVFHLVAVALVFFRDGTVHGSVYTLRHVFDGLAHPLISLRELGSSFGATASAFAFAGLGGFCAMECVAFLRSLGWASLERVPRFASLPRPLRWACYYTAVALAIVLNRQSTQFIYVQF